jgi:lipopolysaccharide transport system permease protein
MAPHELKDASLEGVPLEIPLSSPRRLSDSTLRVLEARRPGMLERLRELWRARRLTRYFAVRYVRKGYQRTWLGWVWLPLRPILGVGSRVLVFGGLLKAPSEGKPYLLFFLVGTSAWQLFDATAYFATRSIDLNKRVLTRTYVPRLTALVGAVAPGAVDFALYFALALGVSVYYRITTGSFGLELGIRTLLAPAGLALMALLALGIGLWLAPFAAQARDVRWGLRYMLSFWYFLTPVIYPLSTVPEKYRTLVELNPLTAPVQMVRAGTLNVGGVPTLALAVTIGTIVVVIAGGLRLFGRAESAAVDSL